MSPPALPAIEHAGWVKNPIDRFVLARLERAGLRPNPPADRATLLRRVTFDLTGLAPTPAERAAFLADRSPDAYERLVDRLLNSPRFGERWAQHWLDVVRFAETEGFKKDALRPDAYRYRDYVIRAFNEDLPYDRFLRQQVAGDELEPDNPDALVATGFYRLYAEESNASNFRQARQDILDDVTNVFGLAVLGVTVGCAKCHDHKFDPITQKDYYRLQAFFAPLVARDNVPIAPPGDLANYRRRLAAWEDATRSVRAEMEALVTPAREQVFQDLVVTYDPETQEALKTAPEKRSPLQRQLAALASVHINEQYGRAARRLPAGPKQRYYALKKQLERFDGLKPPPPATAMAVEDAGPVPPLTHRLGTGNYLRPREVVQPAFPKFLDSNPPDIVPPAAKPQSSGRRSALTVWLCRRDHPLTARVIVNRLWQHCLGQGIVATPNDFGAMGEHATHPELLDYLATELVRQGWRLKPIHRLIVTSAAYRQASHAEANPAAAQAARTDPDDKLLWHARVKRRDAESLRDVVLQLSGQLNGRMYGRSARPELPPALQESRYAWDADDDVRDRNRRSVYLLADRSLAAPLMAAFDVPDRNNSCPVRTNTITAPQALVMLNGKFAAEQARYLAGVLLARYGPDAPRLVRRAYLGAYGREPESGELDEAERFLQHQARLIASGGARRGAGVPDPFPAGVDPAFAAAVTDFCHALINSAELLYVE